MMINFYHYSSSKVKIERGKKASYPTLLFSFLFWFYEPVDSTESLTTIYFRLFAFLLLNDYYMKNENENT